MQNYRFICTALALYITVASFAGHKRTHPDDQESSKSTKRARTGTTQHDLNKKMLAAAANNQWEVVYTLLRLGANIEATTQTGYTLLHIAAKNNKAQAIKTLIQHGARIEATTLDNGFTPLHIATYYGCCQAIKTLIQHDANIEATLDNGFTPLHIATANNKAQAAEILIQHGANIEATIQTGFTPLHIATQDGHYQVIKILIQHGANIKATTTRKGFTPLHLAAQGDHFQAIETFMQHGASIDATITQAGLTPLHIAAGNNHPRSITTLIQHHANIEATTPYGLTPLHLAAANNKVLAIVTLIQCSANIEATTTPHGLTPLHIAAESGHFQAIQTLIQQGAYLMPHTKTNLIPLELYYNYINTQQDTQLHPSLNNLISDYLGAIGDDGDTILHYLISQVPCNYGLLLRITHHPRFTAFNTEHKNMLGYTVLHMCAASNPSLLESLFYTLTLKKTPEKIKRLAKATTPYGDTMNSLKGQPNASPNNSWTPLMHTAFSIHSLTAQSKAQLEQGLKSTDDPAYVTDTNQNALSVAQCEEVKNMIREDIRQKRRAQVSTYLMDEHQQPKVLADLQLQFAGTYEPSHWNMAKYHPPIHVILT